jgi:hypothetical protein
MTIGIIIIGSQCSTTMGHAGCLLPWQNATETVTFLFLSYLMFVSVQAYILQAVDILL